MDYIIIEQTKEYRKRIIYDPNTNTFNETEHDCIFLYRGFSHPYGWLKGSGTPPGEHLDVFLLSGGDCFPGDELPVKVVGVFKKKDGDHKLIGISPGREEMDFSQLPEHEINDLNRLYPRVDEGEGWFGADAAKNVIDDFMENGRVR
ncbi:MAG: inorganic diphosphatase [Defluviitaleaceae bacterium]|nr:inorganic diphosphatase [Defluviitaleaceae bacterium]